MRQAVILAAGRGSRMSRPDPGAVLTLEQRRVADAGGKGMMPIGGRPFLDHVLGELAAVGVERAALVIAGDDVAIRGRYAAATGSGASVDGVRVTLVEQPEPRGTAHALACCRDALDDARFLVLNSDNFYPAEALRLLSTENGMACLGLDVEKVLVSARSNLTRARLAAWAVLETDPDGNLTRILEKPAPEVLRALRGRVLASPNAWSFTGRIFEACDAVAPSERGELELPTAVQYAIEELGCRVRVRPTSGPILDLSTRADVAAVERLLAGAPTA